MFIFKDPLLNRWVSDLLEKQIAVSAGVSQEDGETVFYLVTREESIETSEYHEFRRRIRELHADEMDYLTDKRMSRKTLIENYVANQMKDGAEREVLVRAVALTVERFGRHEKIFLAPLIRSLKDVSAHVGTPDPKDLVDLMKDKEIARVVRDRSNGRLKSSLILNESHPLVKAAREFIGVKNEKHKN